VGRPDGLIVRLELDGLGVGYPVAKLSSSPAPHQPRAGVEALDFEPVAAHGLHGALVGGAALFSSEPLNAAARFPARQQDVAHIEQGKHDEAARIQKRTTEGRTAWPARPGWFCVQSFSEQTRLHQEEMLPIKDKVPQSPGRGGLQSGVTFRYHLPPMSLST